MQSEYKTQEPKRTFNHQEALDELEILKLELRAAKETCRELQELLAIKEGELQALKGGN